MTHDIRKRAHLLVAFALGLPALGGALPCTAATWSVEARLGAPVIPDRRISITQAGQPGLAFTGRFDAATTSTPYHYDVRVVRRDGPDGWAVGFLHSKLVLVDGPAEVTDFQMTHGYNLLTVQRLWQRRGFEWMAGAGVALAHAESTVRGQVFPQDGGLFGWGYHAVAPVLTVGLGRLVDLGRGVYLCAEARGSWSRVTVPVAGGKARFTDLEGHLLAGAGARF